MTPLETVLQHYKLPPHIEQIFPLQIETINDLAPIESEGLWLDVGTGKTLCSTIIALYHRLTRGYPCVVIMPPILIPQWGRWLRSLTPSPSVTEYKGTPKQRQKLSLDSDFVLVGVQIFKKDYQRFEDHYKGRRIVVIADEATFASNVGTDNHDKLYDFTSGRIRLMLSATPMNRPIDAYGLLKFTAPGTYRNKRHFENTHVDEYDFWGQPKRWKDLDVLSENLKINSKRVLFQDMYPNTENPVFDPIEYALDPDHYKLYKRLAEEELLKLPDGGKIDATSANKMLHAIGQIVMNYDYFSGDPSKVSATYDLIEEKLEELGDKKLVIFANYRMSIAGMVRRLDHAGARAINSEVSQAQKERNIQAFLNEASCRVLAIQFKSGGQGLDGLQHVCHHAMFVEPCEQPRDFIQAVGRIARTGQKLRPYVWLPTAIGTRQVRGFRNLLRNDATLNQVIRNAYDLRTEIFGG